MSERHKHIGATLSEANHQDEDSVELDPNGLDSTTIRYLNRDQLSRAELYLCIDKLLEEVAFWEAEWISDLQLNDLEH